MVAGALTRGLLSGGYQRFCHWSFSLQLTQGVVELMYGESLTIGVLQATQVVPLCSKSTIVFYDGHQGSTQHEMYSCSALQLGVFSARSLVSPRACRFLLSHCHL